MVREMVQEHESPFDEAEQALLARVLNRLGEVPASQTLIERNIARVERLGAVVRSYPSLYVGSDLAGHHRDLSTLLDQLARIGPLASPFRFPVKANLARDFVLAKSQLVRSVLMALGALGGEGAATSGSGPDTELVADLRAKLGECIYTLLIEDILLEILFDLQVTVAVRHRAGEWLVRFWDDSTAIAIHDFCPLLESAWRARNQLVVAFGTLMGSTEVMQLMGQAVDARFMDFFCRSDSPDEQRQAFAEFLFGLDHEQLEVLHDRMGDEGLTAVDASWVARTLGLEESELFSGVDDPEAMFLSYRKRRRAAQARRLRDVPGPRRAAESYLMHYLLERP
jgi:hypothetical protein